MVCLDTSFIIALMRRDPKAEKKLEEFVINKAKLSTTPITACELFKGAYGSNRREVEVKKVRDMLSHLKILDFSVECSERYGKLVNDLRLLSAPIGDLDAIIASLALTHSESVLTSDLEHFERVPGLVVETW